MQEYSFFTYHGSGVIDRGWRGRFADDQAACDHALNAANGAPVEVWQGGRKIAMAHSAKRMIRAN